MKKKKQTRKIKQWLAAALGLTLLGTGLWAGMNGEKLQAKSQTTDFQNISLEPKVAGWPFLSQGILGDGSTPESVWQNRETATIPAENSLVFKGPKSGEADMSKIRSSGLDFNSYPIKKTVAKYKLSPDPQWLEIDDVGYYQGKMIGVRVIVQLIDPPSSGNMSEAYIGYAGAHFASVSVPDWLSNGINITYQVYDVDDPTREAIPFSGYFPLEPSYVSTRISVLDWSQIVAGGNHIYSVSATSTPKTQLQYQLPENENVLTLARNSENKSDDAIAVFTFSNQSSLRFRLFPSIPGSKNDVLAYKPTRGAMRIAIPDPEPMEVPDVKEIKADTEMNYQFNQLIPPEPTLKRDQQVQWTLKTDDNKAVVPDVDASGTLKSWTVSDLDVNPMTSKFEVTNFNESTNEVTIAPKEEQYSEDSFYSHYYTFKSKLKIDYTNPIDIDEKPLNEAPDGGKYLDKEGTVILTVDGPAGNEVREEKTFKTSINFAAPVEYQLIDSTTQQPINQTIVPSDYTNNNGLVTWLAPLPYEEPSKDIANQDGYYTAENAPKIPGYQFKSVKLNGQENDMQVKYTKLLDSTSGKYTQNNVVTLYYTPLTYQVGITVKDSKDGEVLSPTGTNPSPETHFEAAVVASKVEGDWVPVAEIDWKELSKIDFTALDKQYQIKQVSSVKEGYDWDKVTNDSKGSPSNPSPKFWVELATNNGTTEYKVKLETGYTLDPPDPYTNHGYLFPEKLTVSGEGATQTRALPLTVINKKIGELELPTLEPIHFGTDKIKDKDGKEIEVVSLPRENTMIQRSTTSEDWKITVKDDRLEPYQTGGWKLEATMKQDFTWTDRTDPTRKSAISNILVFCQKDEDFADATPMGEGDTVEIKKSDTGGPDEITWGAKNGFLLKVDQAKQNEIMAKGTDGKNYVAELVFVLTAGPFSEPGK